MKPQSHDTSPAIEEILLEGYSRIGPREKLERVFDLTQAVQEMAAARIRAQLWPSALRHGAALPSRLSVARLRNHDQSFWLGP